MKSRAIIAVALVLGTGSVLFFLRPWNFRGRPALSNENSMNVHGVKSPDAETRRHLGTGSCSANSDSETPCQEDTVDSSSSAAVPAPGSETRAGAGPIAQDSEQDPQVVVDMPSVDELRDEAAEDPHSTPEGIMRFSATLGERVREALASEATARKAFRELRDCAAGPADGSGIAQIQTLCLSNAKVVVERYPALQGQYEDLMRNVPDRVRSLADLLE